MPVFGGAVAGFCHGGLYFVAKRLGPFLSGSITEPSTIDQRTGKTAPKNVGKLLTRWAQSCFAGL